MKRVLPIAIDDAQLISSTIPETDFGVWDAGTTYQAGAYVIRGHRIWLSSQAGNVGHDPLTATVSWWVDQGPTNRYAMFDGVVGTKTVADQTLTVVLEPGRIDALSLLNVDAAQVTVTQRIGSTVTWQRTISMVDNSAVVDWLTYFTEPIKVVDYALITDIPIYGEATLEITFSKPVGQVSVGICVVGLQADLGEVLRSPTLGITDYSKKTTDDFGNTVLVKRNYSNRMSVKLKIDNSDIDRVHGLLREVRATPAVWVGSPSLSSMTIYGFFKDFSIDVAYATFSYCSIDIEGMI